MVGGTKGCEIIKREEEEPGRNREEPVRITETTFIQADVLKTKLHMFKSGTDKPKPSPQAPPGPCMFYPADSDELWHYETKSKN